MDTQALRKLTADAAAFVESIEAREQDLAAAAEQLSQDAAVRAAFKQGIQHERGRVLALLDHQQGLLKRGGINALVLDALRRQVQELQP